MPQSHHYAPDPFLIYDLPVLNDHHAKPALPINLNFAVNQLNLPQIGFTRKYDKIPEK